MYLLQWYKYICYNGITGGNLSDNYNYLYFGILFYEQSWQHLNEKLKIRIYLNLSVNASRNL